MFYADRNARPCTILGYTLTTFPKSLIQTKTTKRTLHQIASHKRRRTLHGNGNIQRDVKGHFNIQTGLWEYTSLSTHKPKDMMDPTLVHSTQKRNDFINSNNLDNNTRLYGTFELKASTIDATGLQVQCECGSQYSDNIILKATSTLYTRTVPVLSKAYNILCDSGNCQLPYSHAAEDKCIFFSILHTYAGDEIGWDFIQNVLKSKVSFSGFCAELTRKYQTTNVMC